MKTIFVAANIIALFAGIICARPVAVLPSHEVMIAKVIPTPTKPVFKNRWDEFKYKAERISDAYDIPPSVTIGMAAHESNYGKSYLCRVRNNCFGFGASDGNPNGAPYFATPDDGIKAFVQLISTKRLYARAYAARANPQLMVAEIKAAGYASDPGYVAKVTGNPEFINYLK